jgi:sn-glycerol 3-phosphate transport system substrate-binding protein
MKISNSYALTALVPGLLCVMPLAFPGLAAAKTGIDFMFPVPVQGRLAQEMMKIAREFNESQKEVEVTAIFTGDYDSTKMKAAAAQKAGNPPAVVINSANYISDLAISNSILPMQEILGLQNMDAEAFLSGEFWPALHMNARFNGKVYGIPFHNSTPLLYYNKTMLDRAGLKVPQSWDEVVAAAVKLSAPEKGQWGIMLPTINTDYCGWILLSLVYANGGRFYNDEYPGEVYYNTPTTIGALQFWQDLVFKHKVMPKGVLDNNTISTAFFGGKLAMAFLSTGALTFMRENSKDFEMGVAFMPEKIRRGVPIGGASLVCYQGISEEQKKAAGVFIRYLTTPELSGHWSRVTGYFAPRIKAYELPEMRDFLRQNPDAQIALDQLPYARGWYSMYDTVMVRRAMENRVQKMVNDPAYTPAQTAREAQAEADALLGPYVEKSALRVP